LGHHVRLKARWLPLRHRHPLRCRLRRLRAQPESVGDLLLGVPGVQVQDRANPSQDPRIAIRGFGARSAFGVRGVGELGGV
jgi:hypothetical protein